MLRLIAFIKHSPLSSRLTAYFTCYCGDIYNYVVTPSESHAFSLITLMVSADVKHHVYLLTYFHMPHEHSESAREWRIKQRYKYKDEAPDDLP